MCIRDSVYAAFSRYSSCAFWESVLHSCAASAMPIAAAVYGLSLIHIFAPLYQTLAKLVPIEDF